MQRPYVSSVWQKLIWTCGQLFFITGVSRMLRFIYPGFLYYLTPDE